MNDLISRQVAICKCQERLYESALNNVGCDCTADEVFADIAENRIKTWLSEVPSVQPEQGCDECVFKPFKQFQPERKKGKWVECDHDKWNGDVCAYRCSECGGAYHLNNEKVIAIWNFCPNCGAEMKGENDEQIF